MKKVFFGVFAGITFISAFTYLISCLTPYISPVHFWPMAFLALGFPYLALGLLLLTFVWIFIRKKVALFLVLLLFTGFQNLFATFALNPAKSSLEKDTGSLRILTWNVRGFDNPTISRDSANTTRTRMFNYISQVNPDVLCLQEFSEHYMPGTFSNTAELKKLGYIYINRTDEVLHRYPFGKILSGTAIFSKIPFIHSGNVMLGDSSYPEYLASVDVRHQNKVIRIFSTHFKSINLFASPADTSNRVILYGDTDFVYHRTKFEKLKKFAQAHSREALIIKNSINESPYPVVFGTDMNSVPTSFPYHTVSAGLQDAFKLKGWGLGTTMTGLPKTLRIDFLFVDKRLGIKNFTKDEIVLSDHFPQFVDVSLKE